jgi:chromosome partitioning protein
VAADSVILTVKCGHFSLDAVDKMFRYISYLTELTRKETEVEGILLTMYEPKTRVTALTTQSLLDRYGRYVLETVIPKNSTLSEASFYGQPAVLYDAHSRGSKAYLWLAGEIIGRTADRSHSSDSLPMRKAE